MVKIQKTILDGVVLIETERFSDQRGFFCENWNKQNLSSEGIDIDFVQENHSLSVNLGTIRGLHFQTPPRAQDKLIRCSRGRLLDVAVDIRRGSPSYGKWIAQELSFENGLQLLVPKGFLHGFTTLEPDTEIVYKCSDYYSPECDRTIRFDDPDLAIDWGLPHGVSLTLSEKDKNAPCIKDFESPFTYEVKL